MANLDGISSRQIQIYLGQKNLGQKNKNFIQFFQSYHKLETLLGLRDSLLLCRKNLCRFHTVNKIKRHLLKSGIQR